MRLGVVSYDEAPRQADSFVGHFHDAVGHFFERDVPEPLLDTPKGARDFGENFFLDRFLC